MTIIPNKEKRTPPGNGVERCLDNFKKSRKVISRRRKYTIRATLSPSEITNVTIKSISKGIKSSSASSVEKNSGNNDYWQERWSFRKSPANGDLFSWSKGLVKKPMIVTTDKSLRREACQMLKFIQRYMHDRKTKNGKGMEAIALCIATKCWTNPSLRDELYLQICCQSTNNPGRDSVILGWELMAICLSLFPPSANLLPYLESFISHNMDYNMDTSEELISKYAAVCKKRLERMIKRGTKGGLEMPTLEKIYQSRIYMFKPSMFGNTLEEIMTLQKRTYPHRSLPWIQTTLSEMVLLLNGAQTEGIFRISADVNDVNTMKHYLDEWQIVECSDPHVPACLLKLWYRELYEPLIPNQFYNACIECWNNAEGSVKIVQNLPETNRLVLSYLIRFLQVFAAAENATVTKMSASNLAMVMAPNCLRCTCDDPLVIFENSKKEIMFIYNLIHHLDTRYMVGIM